MEKIGLYVHIPFCVKKCNYCGFNSTQDYTSQEEFDYTLALLKEMALYKKALGDKCVVDTVFIGGGTPSVLPENAIGAIVADLNSNFKLTDDCEITIEGNPKTLSYTKLDQYLKSGINRLSIGLQSFHRDELKALDRLHTPQEFYEAYNMARDVGFRNINLDLMFGIPCQTPEKWAATVGVAAKLKPEHISFYSLELEEGTPLYNSVKNDEVKLPSSVDDRVMYHYAIAALKMEGYNHYEISNASLPGFECEHNLKYWSFKPYIGLGLGSSSFFDNRRAVNFSDLKSYISAVNKGLFPFKGVHKNTINDSMAEFVFTGLRKIEGVNLADFREKFGEPFEYAYRDKMDTISKYIKDGYLFRDIKHLKLTEDGIDISNKIMAEFI